MQQNFAAAFAFTLKYEGGWSDNPADTGGATMNGVTLNLYRVWKQDSTLTATDLKKISMSDVQEIFRQNFWVACRGDDLPSGVDLSVVDMAFNAGVNPSAMLLQRSLGCKIDGSIGPTTIAAAAEDDAAALIRNLAERQSAYYQSLTGFNIFGAGWLSRSNARRDAALALVSAAILAPTMLPPVISATGNVAPTVANNTTTVAKLSPFQQFLANIKSMLG